jgi:hypothetical protein
MAGRLFLARLPSLKAPEASGGSRASLVGQDFVVVLDDIRVLRRVPVALGPAKLAEQMRRLAVKNGRTVQQEIRAALRGHVDRESKRASTPAG